MTPPFRLASLCAALLVTPFPWAVCAENNDGGKEAFFEAKIRPVLVSKCYQCHSASSKDPKGALLLDTREGIRRGGESGHAVVPGDIEASLVLDAIKYESFEMPPDEQLPAHVIADFEKWVRMGAIDPRDGKSAPIRQEIDFQRAREFWSFQPIADPKVPQVEHDRWLRSDIDAFIAARLESNGIGPSDDADGIAMARRIYFDVIGMQPSPEEAAAFALDYADNADTAIASLVDRLLDSPQFGERWARHWMDVVRYAESTGMERNGTFPQAWRYRDWVIDTINRDQPYVDFVQQQIAGDLLPYESQVDRDANFVATGMLALGPKSLNEPNKEKFKMDVVDEQIDVVTRAFLGLTASCARCHDHKFDPIPQSEYYALAGILTSTETLYGTGKTNGNRNPGRVLAISGDSVQPVLAGGGSGNAKLKRRYQNQLKSERKKLVNYQKQLESAKTDKAKANAKKRINVTQQEIRKWTNRIKQVTEPKQEYDSNAKLVMAVVEGKEIEDTALRIRGEPNERGSAVPRGFLTIASLGKNPEIHEGRSGRKELADWITDPSNPLTARVMVNRVWQHLFGRGIVSTVNNFGANGDRPTHPQLLDHLATVFVRDGWSLKQLVRRIMLSRVYRQSSLDHDEGLSVDPDNHLLWKMNQRRLEAEAIRDAMLVASGQIDLAPADASIVAKVGDGLIGRNLKADQIVSDQRKRSVYLPIVRGVLPEILRVFDFPEPSIIGGVRDVTTVPTQALYMMNDEFVIETASKLAGRLMGEKQLGDRDRIRLAYQLTVTRDASEEEVETAMDSIQQMQSILQDQEESSESLAWTCFCQSLLASSEFRYVN